MLNTFSKYANKHIEELCHKLQRENILKLTKKYSLKNANTNGFMLKSSTDDNSLPPYLLCSLFVFCISIASYNICKL